MKLIYLEREIININYIVYAYHWYQELEGCRELHVIIQYHDNETKEYQGDSAHLIVNKLKTIRGFIFVGEDIINLYYIAYVSVLENGINVIYHDNEAKEYEDNYAKMILNKLKEHNEC